MPQIVEAPINAIATNPYRRLHDYPYIPSKIEALRNSIKDVGLWPSVMARPLNERLWRYELAFGHHRVEAARQEGLTSIALIVDNLSDRQMLEYMGRENLEDYNANFLIQLEAWEAAIKSGIIIPQKRHPIEIAKLLGWTRFDDNQIRLNPTARACHAAYALIEGGHNTRDEFREMSVDSARKIAERGLARIEQIEKISVSSRRPRAYIERDKHHVGRAIADTAQAVRLGKIPQRDIRSHVDFSAGVRAGADARPSPLFAVFANDIVANLKRTLQTDGDAANLAHIERVLDQITMLEDWEALRRLDVELFNLGKRTEEWQKRLTAPQEKVVQFKALEAKGRG